MAEVTLPTALEVQRWESDLAYEYVRESGLKPYMGTDETAIIRLRNEFKNGAGDTINFPLVTRIRGRGVVGAEVLKGNETDLGTANTAVTVNWIRNGVKIPKSTSFRSAIDLWGAAKPQLRSWSAEKLRDDTLLAFNSIVIPGALDAQGLPGTDQTVNYLLATAGQRNTFLTNNADRVLFGNLKSNASSNVWATAIGNVASSGGRSTAAHVRLLKAMAKTAGQTVPVGSSDLFTTNIRPYKSDMTAGREWFVYFVGSREFRDLSQDATILAANSNARAREGDGMEKNPLFQDGDLMYAGVLIREVPEIDNMILVGAGSGGADIAPGFFCGQSAVAIGFGLTPTLIMDMLEDYEFRPGMAIQELRGTKKTSFGGVQYGVVSSYVAAPADA